MSITMILNEVSRWLSLIEEIQEKQQGGKESQICNSCSLESTSCPLLVAIRSRSVKIDMSCCNGENLRGWLFKEKQFFSILQSLRRTKIHNSFGIYEWTCFKLVSMNAQLFKGNRETFQCSGLINNSYILKFFF